MNLYNSVTRQIADEVRIELTPDEKRVLNESRTVEKEAYDACLMVLFRYARINQYDKVIEQLRY